jgi:hypothetical protein
MNAAIASAHNLAWKLSWVLRGRAGPRLLDTYEAERRPIVEHNLARSVDPDGSRRQPIDEVHVDLAGRIPHRWVDPAGRARGERARSVSTLDLVDHDGLTVLAGPQAADGRALLAAVAGPVPVHWHQLDAATAIGLGIGAHGVALVRPDAIPIAHRSEPRAAHDLAAVVGGFLRRAGTGTWSAA